MDIKQESDMDARVKALWEKMNSGIPQNPKIVRNSSPLQYSQCSKTSSSWIGYLGLSSNKPKPNDQTHVDKNVADLWEQMNKGIPKRTITPSPQHPSQPLTQSSRPTWKSHIGIESSSMQNKENTKQLAAAALSAITNKGKTEVSEIKEFAGEEVEFRKAVDAEKTKLQSASAVDAVLEQIKKKPKMSVLDKTKKDWGDFKEDNKGLEEELDAYKKSTNQYLEKVSFLERTDYREFERERDARLAQQSRNKPDLRDLD